MDPLAQALRGAAGAAAPAAARAEEAPGASASAGTLVPLESVLVLGAGGRLGSALLAEALVAGRFARVQAWVAEAAAADRPVSPPAPARRRR